MPPRAVPARTQPTNTRATAEQRDCDGTEKVKSLCVSPFDRAGRIVPCGGALRSAETFVIIKENFFMCGIVGYVGSEQAAPILLDGLARLEYRGYDSAGIAVVSPRHELQVKKTVGRLKALSDLVHGGADVERPTARRTTSTPTPTSARTASLPSSTTASSKTMSSSRNF